MLFLMDHPDLISQLVSNLHLHSPVPVTAKYRRFETEEKTNEYTERLIQAGAQILSIHGRTREQKGQFTGLANWNIIQSAVQTSHQHDIPIFGNGNILVSSDVLDLMNQTGADGVMTAEGNLYNPAIFAPLNQDFIHSFRDRLPQRFKDGFKLIDLEYQDEQNATLGSNESSIEFPLCTKVASQYLMICRTLVTRTATSAIKGHLHKLFRSVFDTGRYDDIRDRLAQLSWASRPISCDPPLSISELPSSTKKKDRASYDAILDRFQDIVNLIKARLEDDRQKGLLNEDQIDVSLKKAQGESTCEFLKRLRIPYSRCQPYIRPIQILSSTAIQGTRLEVTNSQNDSDPNHLTTLHPHFDPSNAHVGPPPCQNPKGCLNSAAAKCRWQLCKTCCASKTGGINPKPEETVEVKIDEERSVGQIQSPTAKTEDAGDLICEVHAKRAQLELEKNRIKAERRKLKKKKKLPDDTTNDLPLPPKRPRIGPLNSDPSPLVS